MGRRLTVGRWTLDPAVEVQILPPQFPKWRKGTMRKKIDRAALLLAATDGIRAVLAELIGAVVRMEKRLAERSAAENMVLAMILPGGPLLLGLAKSGELGKKTKGRGKA